MSWTVGGGSSRAGGAGSPGGRRSLRSQDAGGSSSAVFITCRICRVVVRAASSARASLLIVGTTWPFHLSVEGLGAGAEPVPPWRASSWLLICWRVRVTCSDLLAEFGGRLAS
jgi:hypothetical protein